MKLYSTVWKEAAAEQIIEKSRFIAHVKPVETKEEADAFITSIRKTYRDATHNVPALVLGNQFQMQWASDDGEPQGTSGAPIVQMLVKEGITNVAVVVTRYFGGIKLGTGGLVRAYTGSAKLGIQAAGICDVEKMEILTYETEYACLPKLQNGQREGRLRIETVRYTDVVSLDLSCRPEDRAQTERYLSDMTAGKGVLKGCEERLIRIPRGKE